MDRHTRAVFLIHGFPDLSFGWHNQISFLSSLGYRVFAPDILGYARTSTPEDLELYYEKNMAADLASLIKTVVNSTDEWTSTSFPNSSPLHPCSHTWKTSSLRS